MISGAKIAELSCGNNPEFIFEGSGSSRRSWITITYTPPSGGLDLSHGGWVRISDTHESALLMLED